ncbi:PTS sugar transporter subunit IIA [Anaerostipes butyraticus]|uniref:PTS galactitol transporter subunit IIA n=1 Tax=Anaerostipes butyraticus TaxID=645466 RepID=A0A916QB71_9FIRM|nr:PTS sugar transporter subunit IIA [Anaerostipes butyraticus]GFO85931.1 PTS galactitol transporter subunit IIA [Anaerostipes butyraticus]HJC82090.1 PTS sugar transporter subunit IIA [Candidatus Anaerostipes avicola]
MVWEKLKKELIIPGLEAKNSDEIFEALGGELVKQGYCKESYVQALKDREAEFPTGINMGEKGVAIPHTDVSHVNKKGIAIATLKEPVSFIEMGTDDEYVKAQVIFMLAVDEKGHLELLQAILGILQDQETLTKLTEAKDAEEIIEIIKEKENM